MKFLVLLALTLSSHLSSAADSCTDLAAQSCAPGSFNDGTGTSELAHPVEYYNSQIASMESKWKAEFAKMLTAPTANTLRETALVAYGYEKEKVCLPANDTPACIDLLSDRVLETYKVQEFGRDYMSGFFFPNSAEHTLKIVESAEYKALAQKFAEEQKRLIPQELQIKLATEIFPRTKELLKERIKTLPASAELKAKMLAKVESAQYKGIDCPSPPDQRTSDIAKALIPNAFYDPENNSFAFCGGFIRISNSEFNLVQTIAHELAHSIDPCRIADGNLKVAESKGIPLASVDDLYVGKNFIKCLRSATSVGAQHFEQEFADPTIEDGLRVHNDTARLCNRDQINETASDWFAAEVVAAYSEKYFDSLSQNQKRAGFANILRPACFEVAEDRNHPPGVKRINGILLVQPKIREQMGCKGNAPNRRYCDVNNPDSLNEKPLRSGSRKNQNKAVQ